MRFLNSNLQTDWLIFFFTLHREKHVKQFNLRQISLTIRIAAPSYYEGKRKTY